MPEKLTAEEARIIKEFDPELFVKLWKQYTTPREAEDLEPLKTPGAMHLFMTATFADQGREVAAACHIGFVLGVVAERIKNGLILEGVNDGA
jgi:hypothetical protein